MLVSYIEDEDLPKVQAVMKAIKKKFPGEGIKLFAIKAEEPF